MIMTTALCFATAAISILLWRREKRREFASVLDRRLLAISARAQAENPHLESYR